MLISTVDTLFLLLLSIQLTSTRAATIGTPTSINLDNVEIALPNRTTLQAEPPPNFSVVPTFNGPRLDATSCLLVSVHAMVSLALRSFQGDIQEQTFMLKSSPNVGIQILAEEPGGTIPTSMAVFGFAKAFRYLALHRHFQSVRFHLMIDDNVYGFIDFLKLTPPPASSAVAIRGPSPTSTPAELPYLFNQTAASTQEAGEMTDNVDATNEGKLKVAFQLEGLAMPIYPVFWSVVAVLEQLAVLSAEDPMSDQIIRVPDMATKFGWENRWNPPRTAADPPYFQAKWMIKALGLIPKYMLSKGKFGELVFVILVDEVPLADCWFRVARSGDMVQAASLNASASDVLSS